MVRNAHPVMMCALHACMNRHWHCSYCAFSFYSTPFLSAQADGMDASARLTALATVLFGLLGSDDVFPSASSPFAILIHVVNFINIVAILTFTAYGFPSCRRRIQNTVGKFQFRDTCVNELGPARKIVKGWDLQRETKHRVWHSFWNSVIVNTCRWGASPLLLHCCCGLAAPVACF